MVECLPAMQETWVQSLGQEDPLEKEMATHSNTLAWKIPWVEEPGRLQSAWSQRVGHDWATELNWTDLKVFLCIEFLSFSQSVSSVAQSCLTLRPHESQHTRPPCPSPTPGVHSDSRPLSPWCHPAISSSVVPFSSCPQSLPASESFPMSQVY